MPGLNGMQVFCLACETGYEAGIARDIGIYGMEPISAMTERIVVRKGVRTREERTLLPGYVLFEAEEMDADTLARLRRNRHFLKVLSYNEGDYALRGADLEFVAYIKRQKGIMAVSRVCKVGNRIRVVDGPLKEFEGCIVEVNRKRSCVAIQFGENSIMNRIWCSIEYVEVLQQDD